MGLREYLKAKMARRAARRITKEYSSTIINFNLEKDGVIEFAQWDNPLVKPMIITQQVVDFFRKFIHEGDLVIDIGANIGDTTVPMALAAGASGTTLAFDPNPFVFKVLTRNSKLNPKKQNIHPYRNAITSQGEEFYYISSEASFGNGGISPTRQSHHGKFVYPEKIKGIPLQQFVETKYADIASKLSFIKIDAEGYDKEIIKSISGLVKKYQPVIVAESFGKSKPEAKAELYNILKNFGYDVFYFEDFFANAEVIKLNSPEDMISWKKTINVYAMPPGKVLS